MPSASHSKGLLNALTAFAYLRLYELLLGFLILAAIFYFTDSIAVPPDLQGKSRFLFALQGPVGFIVTYYFLFGYVVASLLATGILGLTPFFGQTTLAIENALIYAAHSLWVIHTMSNSPPLFIWAAWLIIVIFNFLSPRLLPGRLFANPLSRHSIP